MDSNSDQAHIYRQISDRVSMIGNQSTKQRTVYDAIRKSYRDHGSVDPSNLDTLEMSAQETILLASELVRAIQASRRLAE